MNIKLIIKFNNKNYNIIINRYSSIYSLKYEIYKKINIDIKKQRLFYLNKYLNNNKSLYYYNLDNNIIIDLKINSLKGGKLNKNFFCNNIGKWIGWFFGMILTYLLFWFGLIPIISDSVLGIFNNLRDIFISLLYTFKSKYLLKIYAAYRLITYRYLGFSQLSNIVNTNAITRTISNGLAYVIFYLYNLIANSISKIFLFIFLYIILSYLILPVSYSLKKKNNKCSEKEFCTSLRESSKIGWLLSIIYISIYLYFRSPNYFIFLPTTILNIKIFKEKNLRDLLTSIPIAGDVLNIIFSTGRGLIHKYISFDQYPITWKLWFPPFDYIWIPIIGGMIKSRIVIQRTVVYSILKNIYFISNNFNYTNKSDNKPNIEDPSYDSNLKYGQLLNGLSKGSGPVYVKRKAIDIYNFLNNFPNEKKKVDTYIEKIKEKNGTIKKIERFLYNNKEIKDINYDLDDYKLKFGDFWVGTYNKLNDDINDEYKTLTDKEKKTNKEILVPININYREYSDKLKDKYKLNNEKDYLKKIFSVATDYTSLYDIKNIEYKLDSKIINKNKSNRTIINDTNNTINNFINNPQKGKMMNLIEKITDCEYLKKYLNNIDLNSEFSLVPDLYKIFDDYKKIHLYNNNVSKDKNKLIEDGKKYLTKIKKEIKDTKSLNNCKQILENNINNFNNDEINSFQFKILESCIIRALPKDIKIHTISEPSKLFQLNLNNKSGDFCSLIDKIKNPIFINTTKLISKDFASSIEKYLPYLELSCKENINLETEISKFENKIEKQNKEDSKNNGYDIFINIFKKFYKGKSEDEKKYTILKKANQIKYAITILFKLFSGLINMFKRYGDIEDTTDIMYAHSRAGRTTFFSLIVSLIVIISKKYKQAMEQPTTFIIIVVLIVVLLFLVLAI